MPADRSPLAAAAEALLKAHELWMDADAVDDGREFLALSLAVDALRAAVASDAAWRARAEAAVAVMEAQAGVGVPPDCTCTYFFTSGCRKAGCERRVRQAEYKRQLDAARRRYEETCRG